MKKKLDNEMKERLRTDARKPVTDRVHMNLERFEAYVHRNQLNEVLRPGGRWKPVHGRSVGSIEAQGTHP